MGLYGTPVTINQYLDTEGMNVLTFPVAANLIVVCKALPGTASSAALWRIFEFYDDNAGTSWVRFAIGSIEYKFVADDWITYSYSL